MKLLIILLIFFPGISLASTAKEIYVIAYDWDISELKLCANNAYCSDNNVFSGRKNIVGGSDISLDVKPWVITFLINKTNDKQYEIKGKATNTKNNAVSNFSSIGRFYFDHSIQFNVGKTVISGNVFVGKKI